LPAHPIAAHSGASNCGFQGYLYWPGLLVLSIASVATAPLGARLAHRMDIAPLKIAFAVVLYCLAAYFVLHTQARPLPEW